MSTNRARSVLSVLLLGAAAALGTAGSARAALYTGNWDPAYGGIFPDLGWEASALFDVPDTCLAMGSGSNIPISGACGGFDVLSAEVSFYNVADPGTILHSYALDPNVIVTGIDISGGKLTGVDTGFFAFFVPELPIAGGGDFSFSLILFGGNKAQLIYGYAEQAGAVRDPVTRSRGAVDFEALECVQSEFEADLIACGPVSRVTASSCVAFGLL
jgi:hypothetical protein